MESNSFVMILFLFEGRGGTVDRPPSNSHCMVAVDLQGQQRFSYAFLYRAFWGAKLLIGWRRLGFGDGRKNLVWAMLVPACIVLFNDSCGEKNKLSMLPHSHRIRLCIEPCTASGEKRLCHTVTDAKKVCKPKKQPPPIAVL